MLEQLGSYNRSLPRRNGWIFPSLASKRANDPITDKVVWHACHESTRRAGITKPVHPHTLRHYAASRTMPCEIELSGWRTAGYGVGAKHSLSRMRHSPEASELL